MRESRTYGSVRGAQDETCVPTATGLKTPAVMNIANMGTLDADLGRQMGPLAQLAREFWLQIRCKCSQTDFEAAKPRVALH